MKLVQAINKKSKVIHGAEDSEVTSEADSNGGYDIGIYDTNFINLLMEPIPENERFNKTPFEECGYGVQICHEFTKEHCDSILKNFKSLECKTVEYEGEPREAVMIEKDNGIFKEYFDVLVELFSDTKDLPVYYLAC